MNIQGDYGNPIHGVSNQPDARMFAGQSRELLNCRCDPTKGLSRRSPFEFVARLQVDDASKMEQVKWKAHERGDGSAIITAYCTDKPRLFDLNGASLNFRFESEQARVYYQSGTNPVRNRFGLASVLDTTFLTNREVIPTGNYSTDDSTEQKHFLWLEFKTFEPGSVWEVDVGGNHYGSMLFLDDQSKPARPIWDGWYSPTDTEAIKRQNESYQGAYNAETFMLHWTKQPVAGMTAVRYNNWVGLYYSGASTNKIILSIISGGDSIKLHDNRSIKAIEQLPTIGMTDILAVVEEGQGAELSRGYFKSTLSTQESGNNHFGPVSWKETVAAGSSGVFNANTMPHVIQWDTDSWVLKEQDWKPRQVGDRDSNPYPSFIINKAPIQSVGLFQNRVFYGASETLMFSAVDVYADLWVESAYYHTDADPFELTVDSDKVNLIQYAGTFDKDLIFFSQNGQFIMPGDQTHTYEKSFVQTATNYQADLTADPVLAGDNILFAFNNGSFAGVREYYTDNASGSQRSTPTTNHVDTYMEGSISHLASSTSIDALFVMLSGDGSTIYVNEWMREGNEKVQNAWHKWDIAAGLSYEWVGFIGSLVYAVVSCEGNYYLLRMRWDTPKSLYGLPFTPFMDCMKEEAPNRVEGGYTIYRVPFKHDGWVFVEAKGSYSPGFELSMEKVNDLEYRVRGVSDKSVIVGLRFPFYWVPSLPRVTDQRDVTQELQRLQLGQLTVHFSEVGKIDLSVTSPNGRVRVNSFTNRRLDNPNNRFDFINTHPDSWQVPVRQNVKGLGINLYTDAVTPVTIRGMEWSGDYKQRGRRV